MIMKYRTISKYLVILATLLLGATVFIGCSDEEKETGGGSFFKISVTEEAFGNTDLTRAITEAQADTVITPIDNDLYMETILSSDYADSGVTRASSASQANVKSGTVVNVLAYSGNTYVGQITGTVGTNGSVTMADNQLALGPGTYTFVCLANVDIDSGHRFFEAKKGSNSMSGKVEKTIQSGDKDCKLTFVLQHRVGQIRITVRTESDPFNGLSATLNSSTARCPYTQQIALPSTNDISGGHSDMGTINDTFFSNVSGMVKESNDEKYYIGGYNYTNWTTISLNVTSGTIGGQSIAGKSVNFSNFDVQQNKISKVTISFRRQSLEYAFALSSNTMSVPAAGGNTATYGSISVTSTLNGSSQGWGVEALSTAPLTETGGNITDVSSIVTSYSPQTYNGTNGGSPSIVLSANTSTSPRTVYVRLKQEGSEQAKIITITQAGATPIPSYTVTLNAEAGGYISPSGSTTYPSGTQPILSTAYPNANYTFDGWYKNGGKLTTSLPGGYTVSGSTITVEYSDKGQGTYTAKFTPVTPVNYTITFNADAGGNISLSGPFSASSGSKSSTATPNSGYTFDGWYKNGVKIIQTSGDYYTSGNTITANFNKNGSGTYTAKFAADALPQYYIRNENDPLVQNAYSIDDVLRLLGTPNAIYYDDTPRTYVLESVTKTGPGHWILRKEYYGSTTAYVTMVPLKTPDDVKTSKKYFWMPMNQTSFAITKGRTPVPWIVGKPNSELVVGTCGLELDFLYAYAESYGYEAVVRGYVLAPPR